MLLIISKHARAFKNSRRVYKSEGTLFGNSLAVLQCGESPEE